jgi:hypothetical protein
VVVQRKAGRKRTESDTSGKVRVEERPRLWYGPTVRYRALDIIRMVPVEWEGIGEASRGSGEQL